MTTAACFLATRSHLHLAHATAVSFRRHHPDAALVFLHVDDDPVAELDRDLGSTSITLAELAVPGIEQMRARSTTFELCNALKPFLLQHVLRAGHERAVYLDSDLWFEGAVEPILARLDSHPVVVTPHLLRPSPDDEATWRDLAIAVHGSLNGGFVAVRSDPRAEAFLAWWGSRVRTAGQKRLEQGLNCDQRWLDLVPGFAIDAHVDTDPGCNVAYWNLHERTIDDPDDRPTVDGSPLRFVHFSGFDPDDPVQLTNRWSTYTLDNRPDLRPIAERYRAQLLKSRSRFAPRRASDVPDRVVTALAPVAPLVVAPGAGGSRVDPATLDVSVVVAVRNGGPRLRDAVDSALRQRDVAVEVVVVDDGSAADPTSLLPVDDPRVRLVRRPALGVSAARNHGIALANGRAVAFLDADDVRHDDLGLRDQLRVLDGDAATGIVHAGWTVVDEAGTVLAERSPWEQAPTLDLVTWATTPVVLPSAMLFRRDALRAVDGFDTQLDQAEDVDLVWRLARAGWASDWVRRGVTTYLAGPDGASRKVDRQETALLRVYGRMFGDLPVGSELARHRAEAFASLHCWLAAAFRRASRDDDMVAHLAASTVWLDETNPLRLARHWAERIRLADADLGAPPPDTATLLVSPAFARLQRLRPLELRELGVRRTVTLPPEASRPGPCPAPGAVAARIGSAAPAPCAATGRVDLRLALARTYGRHRSGWSDALRALEPLHDDAAPLLDPFVEHTYAPGGTALPAGRPWVGVVHNPPGQPDWYPIDQTPERLFQDDRFHAALADCQGLWALSDALADWWRKRVDVPVEVLRYPCQQSGRDFSMAALLANPMPRLVQVGSWLRRLTAIASVPTRVLRPTVAHQHLPYIDELLRATVERTGVDLDGVEVLPFLEDHDYDELLAANVVFVDLIAASANTTIVECIARGTPILVNPLPAVREYLGDDYPLYYATHREAGRKAEDRALLQQAHEHLVAIAASGRLSPAAFADAVAGSSFLRTAG